MNKQPEITEATRRSIMDAFWLLYQEMSVDRITVERLASEAHVHRSTFYRYFRDVYDVLEQIQDRELTELAKDAGILAGEQRKQLFQVDERMIFAMMSTHAERTYYLLRDDPGKRYRKKAIAVMLPLVRSLIREDCTEDERTYIEVLIPSLIFTNIEYLHNCKTIEQAETMITIAQKTLRGELKNYLKTKD